MMRSLLVVVALFGVGLGCGGDDDSTGGGDAGVDGGDGGNADGGDGDGGGGDCGGETCGLGSLCRYDTCVPNLGACETFDDCPGDSYCDENGECIPYGVPPEVTNDPECVRAEPLEGVVPIVQCEWTDTEDGDLTEGSNRVYTAPLVADLNLDGDPGRLQPSVVVTTWETVDSVRTGTLRVFDGRTCEEQMRFGGDDEGNEDNRPAYGTQWAIGDLDGDVPTGGHPEIVGLHRTSPTENSDPLQLYAVRVNSAGENPVLERMWYGRDCANDDAPIEFASNAANYGPGLWDLDDDGTPEILIDSMVFDAGGCLLSTFEDFDYITHNRMNTVADVDADGVPELVMADRMAEWDSVNNDWVDEDYFVTDAAQLPGHVAIADLGQYSALGGTPTPNTLPEVVVVSAETLSFDPDSTGTIRVQTLDGAIVWGPMDLYFTAPETAGGHGGAPTAADFDGDGQVEFAAAANQFYTVYDPDCVAALGGTSPVERPGGTCVRAPDMEDLPDGILWAQLSQDRSSSGTGSSVFDFNGDGAAEAVYRDECYLRVYEGATGEVIYSAPASNGTGFELPVIVDVDGDFATEIVVARSPQGTCPSPDPLFPDSGDAASTTGFVILRDAQDRWAPSRPVWNQHAYHVTNVTDDAQIPRTSQTEANWLQPELNNFRQNTQGELGVLQIADLTVVLSAIEDLCAGDGGDTTIQARVCNRGTNPVTDGVEVAFLENDDLDAGPEDPGAVPLCSTLTSQLLLPGECQVVECSTTVSANVNVFVLVDPSDEIADCHPGNNDGASVLDLCTVIE